MITNYRHTHVWVRNAYADHKVFLPEKSKFIDVLLSSAGANQHITKLYKEKAPKIIRG